jgi:hypothetical protein
VIEKRRSKAAPISRCEDCEYFNYYPEDDVEECSFSLDEDEYRRFLCGDFSSCPYYKPYNEYKSVQKQN